MKSDKTITLFSHIYHGDGLPHYSLSLADRDLLKFLVPEIIPEQVQVFIEKGILYVEVVFNEGNNTITTTETFFMEEHYDILKVSSNLNRGILTVELPYKEDYNRILNIDVKVR